MEGVGSQFNNTLDSLKMEQLKVRIINLCDLDGICAMSITNIISFIIFILLLKSWLIKSHNKNFRKNCLNR